MSSSSGVDLNLDLMIGQAEGSSEDTSLFLATEDRVFLTTEDDVILTVEG